VPEAQAARLVRGQKVKATLQADASQTFEGELKEVLPEVSTTTRTLKARFEVDNRAGRLTPGMLLRLAVAGPRSERLVVSTEAVIRTGKRAVVIVRNPQGGFEPRDVSLGADFGDEVEVLAGLNAGDQVVASGQFLIDSEARLRSVLGNMSAPASAAASSAAGERRTVGPRRPRQGRKRDPRLADDLARARGDVELAGHDDGLCQAGSKRLSRTCTRATPSTSALRKAVNRGTSSSTCTRWLRERRNDRRPDPLVDRQPRPRPDRDGSS
jgi:hypothetical protein